MTRDESAREDLLRDATALVERVKLAANESGVANDGSHDRIIVGFRSNGAASFFFGDDPVYQFNAAGELRRAFCGGRLYKAVLGRLVVLQRQHGQGVVQLLSRELTAAEQTSLMSSMQKRLRQLAGGLESDHYLVIGQVPAETDLLGRARNWLATHDGLLIAVTPKV